MRFHFTVELSMKRMMV